MPAASESTWTFYVPVSEFTVNENWQASNLSQLENLQDYMSKSTSKVNNKKSLQKIGTVLFSMADDCILMAKLCSRAMRDRSINYMNQLMIPAEMWRSCEDITNGLGFGVSLNLKPKGQEP